MLVPFRRHSARHFSGGTFGSMPPVPRPGSMLQT
jgi:hypothetical protein